MHFKEYCPYGVLVRQCRCPGGTRTTVPCPDYHHHEEKVEPVYVYAAKQNSDLTEGRGAMVTIALLSDEQEAVKLVQGRGVMGVGPGEVYKVLVYPTAADVTAVLRDVKYGLAYKGEEKVYGYRRDLAGHWGYGYVDNRDAPTNDPEYAEYLRLEEKFRPKTS